MLLGGRFVRRPTPASYASICTPLATTKPPSSSTPTTRASTFHQVADIGAFIHGGTDATQHCQWRDARLGELDAGRIEALLGHAYDLRLTTSESPTATRLRPASMQTSPACATAILRPRHVRRLRCSKAGCNTIAAQRLTLSGMRWTIPSAIAIIEEPFELWDRLPVSFQPTRPRRAAFMAALKSDSPRYGLVEKGGGAEHRRDLAASIGQVIGHWWYARSTGKSAATAPGTT